MRLHHLCIETDCYARSLAFYEQALGMALVEETPGFHGREYNTWLRGDGFFIELQTPRRGESLARPEGERAGIAHFCVYADDLDAACAALRRAGARFLQKGGADIYEVNGGRLFKVEAPEGTVIEFRDKEGV
ncbi:MAG: VOC family protein [Oscillospiraceae bacterium]|nr:VOC family protein [Oscillospiraceae bacterium]